MYALIGAGALAPRELRELGVERIPLLSVGGETILARTCRCLIEGAGASSVYVIAPAEVPLPEHPLVKRLPASGNLVSDSYDCLKADASAERILVSGSDMPLITPEAVRAVVEAGQHSGADLLYPVCPKEVIEARFPGTKRTYLRMRGSTVSGGNMFSLNRAWMLSREDFLREAFAQRKNKLKLAGLIGPALLLRVATGTASMAWLEKYIGRRLGGRMVCAPLDYPEMAVDLDKAADLELFAPWLDPPWGRGES